MRRGFTLLELMVASLLLGMLVAALTMLFNSSAVAWRNGTASVMNLTDVRAQLGLHHDEQDDVLPHLGGHRMLGYRTVSPWDPSSLNSLRIGQRAFGSTKNAYNWSAAENGSVRTLGGAGQGSSATHFTVGVRSAGPNGVFDGIDDITTWPEDVK